MCSSDLIEVGGQAAHRLSPASARALGIAAIYQQPALFPDLSVAENIALGLEKPNPARRVRWSERVDPPPHGPWGRSGPRPEARPLSSRWALARGTTSIWKPLG